MNNMESQLWKIANDLRGSMDSSEFKNYMLGFMFLKFLSDKIEFRADEELKEENVRFCDVSDPEYLGELRSMFNEELGYFIEPEFLYSSFVKRINAGEMIIEPLSQLLVKIVASTQGLESEGDFIGLFDDLDLSNNKLGVSSGEKNKTISDVMLKIDSIEGLTVDVDILGNAYEYLLKMFASDAGKSGGEFYTPGEVSTVVARLVTVGRGEVNSVYDPTCGSGSLLLNVHRHLGGNVNNIYGQELNVTTYNLARMNMFLHGVKFHSFKIKQGNTLTNDRFADRYGDSGFDLIVANPPFGVKWDADSRLLTEDERFMKYGKLAPKSKGEYAFLQHMLFHLADNGVMASVVPHGVLFRGAAELAIRKYMIERDNVIDAVIGLPSNLFYGTGIPACIIVFKKCREHDDVLFIDASKEFEKVKTQNVLTDVHMDKIITTYSKREEIEKYSRCVSIDEIRDNDFNLNIPRYVDTFEEEEPIDINEVNRNIKELKEKIALKEAEIESMIKAMFDEDYNLR